MKKLLPIMITLLFSLTNSAQPAFNYAEQWKKVVTLEKDTKTTSALRLAKTIAQHAEKENNTQQQVKALLYQSKFSLLIEEEAQEEVVDAFTKAIATHSFPTKNILQQHLAKFYTNYYEENQYKIDSRTFSASNVNESYQTWDEETFRQKISALYTASLAASNDLYLTPITTFKNLIETNNNALELTPNLLNILATNALQYYSSINPNTPTLTNDALLADYQTFASTTIHNPKANRATNESICLFQTLLNTYQEQKNELLLTLTDINRLDFVFGLHTAENKNELYEHTLKALSLSKDHQPEGGYYSYALAAYFYEQGSLYSRGEHLEMQFNKQHAVAYCEAIMNTQTNGVAAKNAAQLLQKIKEPSLKLTSESFIRPLTPALLLVHHKNTDTLYVNVLKTTYEKGKVIQQTYIQDSLLQELKQAPVVHTEAIPLTSLNDFQEHSTEVVLPVLSPGNYMVYASSTPLSKANTATTFAYKSIQATTIAVIESSDETKIYLQCVNRTTGKPLKKAKVTVTFQNRYASYPRANESHITDSNGFIQIKKQKKGYYNYSITVSHQKEKGIFENFTIGSPREKYKYKPIQQISAFTDRAIYRPSQTIHFKGILFDKQVEASRVTPNVPITVTLDDVNNETIAKLTALTNDFGSISGKFTLPKNVLTGTFKLRFKSEKQRAFAVKTIRVENYKRPKFSAEFLPITKIFAVNDTVVVKGKATNFAGSPITNGKIRYSVRRSTQLPYWYYWRMPNQNRTDIQIAQGKTNTNSDGSFTIPFSAVPDLSIAKKDMPIFQYVVTATVTDSNGESHETKTTIHVGYHSINAEIVAPTDLDLTAKNNSLLIKTTNLNGEFTPIQGTVTIHQLESPTIPLRKRPWEAAEYNALDKQRFKTLFPYEAFGKEDKQTFWPNKKLVYHKELKTSENDIIAIPSNEWDAGTYAIRFNTTDSNGFPIQAVHFVTATNHNKIKPLSHQLFTIQTNKSTYEPGETALITLASGAPSLHVTIERMLPNTVTDTKIYHLKNNTDSFSVPITKNAYGGVSLSYSYVYQNTHYSGTYRIPVPYPSSELQIETATFRDKLSPGKEEKWSFTLKGPKGEQLATEMLASMYDASLDTFTPHQWSFSPLYQTSAQYIKQSRAYHSFGTQQFKNYNTQVYFSPALEYYPQQLSTFGFTGGNQFYAQRNYMRLLVQPQQIKGSIKKEIPKGRIEGVVYDAKGNQLPRANIIISGTSRSAITDFDGNFDVAISSGETISISYIGFKTIRVPVGSSNYYEIILQEDNTALEEVVTLGYGLKRSKSMAMSSADVVEEVTDEAEVEETIIDSTESNIDAIENNIKQPLKIRADLKETAFFYPQLQTNTNGEISFNFTTPEALTQWKLQLLAHSKNLNHGIETRNIVTQKELMVFPNTPRFVRETDTIILKTKIANLTSENLKGIAHIECSNPVTGELVNTIIQSPEKINFTITEKGNTSVAWKLIIPKSLDALQYRVIAETDRYSDGEENTIPVLKNRILVTESLPFWIRKKETKFFELSKLVTQKSTTLQHHKVQLEAITNPAWYAIQSLPYVMEYPYECNEQTFARYYANTLGQIIVESNPKIKNIIQQWATSEKLLSALQKNEALKQLLLQETPWLREAKTETEQKRRIALLFDSNTLKYERQQLLKKLNENQLSNGGWSWFNGGNPNRYITQHIVSGFGKLRRIAKQHNRNDILAELDTQMLPNAVRYIDNELVKEYQQIIQNKKSVKTISAFQAHYLYTRSFYKNIDKSKELIAIYNTYLKLGEHAWKTAPLATKGWLALSYHRRGNSVLANSIINSLQENSTHNEEMGMYWKQNIASWRWNEAPIETHALLTEAFAEIASNTQTLQDLQLWLLKQKQTQHWKTTKATTEAIYAILLQSQEWLSLENNITIQVAGTPVLTESTKNREAGTGLFTKTWQKKTITPSLGNLQITKKTSAGTAWGALYWQYFEELDQITSAKTPLQLQKQVMLVSQTNSGEVMHPITEHTKIQLGDVLRIRITLKADRAMEYVHLKDLRAAGLEPKTVLSHYKWQGGLGYYESTKDASTDFFMDYLPKGIYVFEYDVTANNPGSFSNGIATIQCMYAPEFSSHSEGLRLTIVE